MTRQGAPGQFDGASPLRRSQLLGLPFSGVLLGPLVALTYAPWLGATAALRLGVALSFVLGGLAGWMVFRSDYAARHAVAGVALYALLMAGLLGGAAALASGLNGRPDRSGVACVLAVCSLLIPLAASAGRTRSLIQAQGAAGPWVLQHLDPDAAAMRADALARAPSDGSAPAPWVVAALSVNLVWLFRVQGGTDALLLLFGIALLAAGAAWLAVAHIGPMLGKALIILRVERQSGIRYRHEHWAGIQAVRRSRWWSRLLMPAKVGD